MNPSDLNIPGFRPQNDLSDWDGKRTTVLDPIGNVMAEYFNGETPELYIQGNTGRVYQGVPGTPEYDAMQKAHKKSTKRGIATVAAVVGGGALGGALAGGAGAGAGGGSLGFTGAGGGGMSLGQVGQMAGRGALMRGFMPGEGGGMPTMTGGGLTGGILGELIPDSGTDWVNLLTDGKGVLGAMAARNQASPPAPGGVAPGNPTTISASPLNRMRNPVAPDYFTYGKSGGEHRFFQDANSNDGSTPPASGTVPGAGAPPATGYVPNHMLTGLPRRGVLARAGGGPTPVTGTGGRTDDIEALLSEGEYVMDAETVALLGDGSTEAGARRLDELRENLRKHKGAALAKGKFTPAAKSPDAYMAKGGRIDVPNRNRQRMVDLLEKRTPNYKEMSDAQVEEHRAWLDKMRELPRPKDETAKAKGGRVPRLPEEVVERGPRSERQANLAMLLRLKQAIQKDQLPREGEDVGSDPRNRTGPRAKKAHGGRVEETRGRLAAIQKLMTENPVQKLAKGGPAVADMNELADKLEAALKIGDLTQIDTAMEPVVQLAKGGKVVTDDIVNQILEKYRPKQPTRPEDLQAIVEHLRRLKPDSEVLQRYNSSQKPRIYRPSEVRKVQ